MKKSTSQYYHKNKDDVNLECTEDDTLIDHERVDMSHPPLFRIGSLFSQP